MTPGEGYRVRCCCIPQNHERLAGSNETLSTRQRDLNGLATLQDTLKVPISDNNAPAGTRRGDRAIHPTSDVQPTAASELCLCGRVTGA